MMEVTFHQAMEPLAEEWDALADRAGAGPFQRPGWLIAWWRAYGSGALRVLTLRHEGRLVGLVPLRRQRGVLRSLTNAHTPEFGPVVEESYSREVVRALFERPRRRITMAYLAPTRPDLDDYGAVATERGYLLLQRTFERSPYIATNGTWSAYEQSLDNKFRADLRRRRRRLEEKGTVSCEFHDGREGLPALLEEGYRVEAAGWKGREGTAILCRPDTRQFYTEVARWAADRGSLRLGFLRLDGVALAFEYALQEGDAYYRVKGGFNPDYGQFSPGKLFVYETIKRAFDEKLSCYHFLGHDEPYKLEWTTTSTVYPVLHAFGRTVLGRAEWSAYAYVRPLALRLGLRR
jgi:CelD/BcsL family acetyltransferase involved in cellulose biosynthesis